MIWELRVAGTANTCKNKDSTESMKKLAVCAGVFSHSAVNNNELDEIQEMQDMCPTSKSWFGRMTRSDLQPQ